MFNRTSRFTLFLLCSLVLLLFLVLVLGLLIYGQDNNNAIAARFRQYVYDKVDPFIHPTLCPDCNVILVSLDTLSANHLPCYGYARDTSPRLCEFAKENIIFKNMYANAHFTLPSHTTMFTGLLPSRHGVNVPTQDSLNPHVPFLPEVLQKKGYFTYFNMPIDDTNMPLDKVYNRGISKITEESYRTLDSWQNAFDIFEKNESHGKKTFLFLHTYYVHSPYFIKGRPLYTNKKFADIPFDVSSFKACDNKFITAAEKAMKEIIENGDASDRTYDFREIYRELTEAADPIKVCMDPANEHILYPIRLDYYFSKKNINTSEKVAYLKDLYDQRINELDAELFNTLFAFINKPGIKSNTILIITADHGEEFMEHNEISHLTIYDSNVKIPLIMYVPHIEHRVIENNAQTADIMPTILDLLGIKNAYSFQGISLLPTINGATPNRVIIAQRGGGSQTTVRDQTYKMFLKESNSGLVPYELYNIQKDPGEQKNLLFLQPEEAGGLQQRLKQTLLQTSFETLDP